MRRRSGQQHQGNSDAAAPGGHLTKVGFEIVKRHTQRPGRALRGTDRSLHPQLDESQRIQGLEHRRQDLGDLLILDSETVP